MSAWDDLVEGVCKGLSVGSAVWLSTAWVKFKKDEWAKPGKVGRMIGDLGVAASLQAFLATKAMKESLDGRRLRLRDGEFIFIARPRPEVLGPIFREILFEHRFLFIAFSDDGAFGYRDENNEIYTFNIDISKCDRSHVPSAFVQLRDAAPSLLQLELDPAINQLKGWNRVKSTLHRDKSRCWFRTTSREPILLSGSVLTTVINTMQLGRIAYAISSLRRRGITPTHIRAAAAIAGYSVSVEINRKPEDLQFLKHSPCLVNGQYEAVLNLGVLLRASGISKGDYPGSSSDNILDRAALFQALLVQGCYPRHDFTLRNALIPSVPTTVRRRKDTFERHVQKHLPYHIHDTSETRATTSDDPILVTDDAILARYDLLPHEQDELCHTKYLTGHCYSSSAIDKILLKDYGLHSAFGLRAPHPHHQLPLVHRQ